MIRILATTRTYREVFFVKQALEAGQEAICDFYGGKGCNSCDCYYSCRDLKKAVNYCDKLLAKKVQE